METITDIDIDDVVKIEEKGLLARWFCPDHGWCGPWQSYGSMANAGRLDHIVDHHPQQARILHLNDEDDDL